MKIFVSYALIPIALLCLVSFGLLEMHNLSQTEYLIFYDFWDNYTALKDGSIYPFFFHNNVHTYAVASAIWYLDVLFANGSLKLVHAYVIVATLSSIYCLFILTRRIHRISGATFGYSAFIGVMAAAMWLSPSNASCFAYPLVDIVASTLLLLLSLAVIVVTRGATEKRTHKWASHLGYLGIVCLGFLTLETFLVVPLVLAVNSMVRSLKKESVSHISLAVFLFLIYLVCIRQPLAATASDTRDIGTAAHNFLFLLSSHYELLFSALGMSPRTSAGMGQWISALQLAYLLILAWRRFTKPVRTNPSVLFPFLLAALGIVSIGLATWLRYGTEPLYEAVPRYTPYSVMFSVAILLLASAAPHRDKFHVLSIVGIVIVAANLCYLGAEWGAMWRYSHNAAKGYIEGRLEMAVYALSPGNEVHLGPAEPDNGLHSRSDLHGFLKERELSVFSSDGYRSLGKLLSSAEAISDNVCVQRDETYSRGVGVDNLGYRLIAFDGIKDDGYFLVADTHGRIVNFSFSARLTPMDSHVFALLPENSVSESSVFFAHVHEGKLTDILRCR